MLSESRACPPQQSPGDPKTHHKYPQEQQVTQTRFFLSAGFFTQIPIDCPRIPENLVSLPVLVSVHFMQPGIENSPLASHYSTLLSLGFVLSIHTFAVSTTSSAHLTRHSLFTSAFR
jgi:hypothetical protein